MVKFNRIVPFVFLPFSFILYLLTLAQGPGFGDELRFIIRIEEGYDLSTNATNHIFYSNLLVFIAGLMSFLTPFKIGVCFSAIMGSIVVWRVASIADYLYKNNVITISMAMASMLSFTFWRQSVTVEVYTFNLVFIILFTEYIIKYLKEFNETYLQLAGFLLGFSLWIHIQNILLVPSLLFVVYQSRQRLKSLWSFGFSFLALILFTQFYSESTLYEMIFGSQEYLHKATGFDLRRFIIGFLKSDLYFLYNFGVYSIFILFGIFVLYKQDYRLFLFCMIGILPTWLFASNYDVPDHYVFFLPAYFIMLLFAGKGIIWLKSIFHKKNLDKTILIASIFPLLMYFLLPILLMRVPSAYDLHTSKEYKGGLRYLIQPWMHNKPDILSVVIYWESKGVQPPFYEDTAWSYDIAKAYISSQNQSLNEDRISN